jgi:hypothetical protein
MGRFVGHIVNSDPQRLERILDAKTRQIGVRCELTCSKHNEYTQNYKAFAIVKVDVQALDAQTEEKRRTKALEQTLDK